MIAVITTAAPDGPRVHANSAAPTRWPLVPIPTGKLIICAANTKAPRTPSSGIRLSSKSREARRAISPKAGMLMASITAHTGVDRKLSGICIGLPYGSTILPSVRLLARLVLLLYSDYTHERTQPDWRGHRFRFTQEV